MGITINLTPVKKICALMSRDEEIMTEVESDLIPRFGNIESRSLDYKFDFTDYYKSEMGDSLIKRIVSFVELQSREKVWEDKTFTNHIESMNLTDGKRLINIDPGYLDNDNLILLSTKKAPHRIYLSDGIYSEVTLMYMEGSFKPNRFTYADFRTGRVISFLNEVRDKYLTQLKSFIRSSR